MKRRDFLISSAVLPVAAAFPTSTSAKAPEKLVRPALDEAANFQRSVTVLGTSNPEWRSAYVVDLYRRAKTLYDTRAGWDMFGVGPSVAFGNKAFLDDLKQARPVPNFYLHSYVYDMTTKPTLKDREGAVLSAMRCNSPLVMLEDLDRQEPLVPSELLPKLFMAGIHVSAGMAAPTKEVLFERIAPKLGVWNGYHEAYAWAGTLEGGRSKVQVFYDGENVTDAYITWLRGTLSRPIG